MASASLAAFSLGFDDHGPSVTEGGEGPLTFLRPFARMAVTEAWDMMPLILLWSSVAPGTLELLK